MGAAGINADRCTASDSRTARAAGLFFPLHVHLSRLLTGRRDRADLAIHTVEDFLDGAEVAAPREPQGNSGLPPPRNSKRTDGASSTSLLEMLAVVDLPCVAVLTRR